VLAFRPGGYLPEQQSVGLLDVERRRIQWIPAQGPSESVAISRDGKRLAARISAEIVLWERTEGSDGFRRQRAIPFDETHSNLAFSPDGERLAVSFIPKLTVGPRLHLWDLRNDPPTRTDLGGFPPGMPAGQPLDWSHDGTRLLTGGPENSLTVWNVAGPQPRIEFTAAPTAYMRFSADGQRVVATDRATYVTIRGTMGLHPFHTWQFPGEVMDVAYHPSREFVATVNSNGTVYILRVPESAR
jgi:WD40 repeat protein